ncbi:MAG: PTS sugar transporter subunit IIA [Coprobacillus sp.]
MVNLDCILMDLEIKNKEDIMYLLIHRLKMKNYIENTDDFLQTVLQRENVFPTSIGKMIAIPHGMSEQVKRPIVCFGRLKKPIIWDQTQQDSVSIVILIAVPIYCQDIHIHIISHLVRHFLHNEYVQKLLICQKQEIYEMLKEGLESK